MPGNNRIFISHTHGDNELCLPLLAALDAWDVDYWFDVQQLDAGQQLSQRLQQAIAERDVFIRVLTPTTPQSFWMTQELQAFRGLQAEEARLGRSAKRRVILLALTPDAPREPAPPGDLVLDAANQPQIAWLRQLRDAVGVSARPRPLSRRAVIGLGAAAAAGIVVASAGGTYLLTGNRGAPVSAAPVPKTTAPTPTTQPSANRVKWTFRASGDLGLSLAVSGDTAYLLASDGLYALGAADGAVKWHQPQIQGGSRGGLLVDGDTLYVATDYIGFEVGVVAVAAADGARRWLTKLANSPSAAPALVNGMLYVANAGTISALTADGTPLWTTPYAHEGNASAPVVANGHVYIGGADNALHMLDAVSGHQVWQYGVSGPIGGTPALGAGVVCFTAEDGNLYALDLATRAPRWAPVKIGSLVDSTPTIQDGVVYVGSGKSFLNAFDLATGTLRWQAPAGEQSDDKTYVKNGVAVNAPPFVAGDTLYVVAANDFGASLYAYNRADGNSLWHYDSVDSGFLNHESPPIVRDGQVYYCGGGQTLYVLDA